MYSLFGLANERLVAVDTTKPDHLPVVWVDLLNPTDEEEAKCEQLLGIDVPTRDEMAEIEVSSRLYSENDSLYMTATLLAAREGDLPEAAPVTFILGGGRLVTVRYSEPGVFRTFAARAKKADVNLRDADTLFIALIEAIIDRTADILERAGAETDAVSRAIFGKELTENSATSDHKELLGKLGRSGDLNARVRESLVSLGRLVNFLTAECGEMHPALRERTDTMMADVRSLSDHATFVASTINFLLDALLGLINIEQNSIIKVVSVISVLIMPPTLVASIYGMNFQFMPELGWRFGYPAALLAMAVAGILPYWIFKRRNWL